MRPPLFIRSLPAEERTRLKAALRQRNAFITGRAQIVRARAGGERPRQIAANLGCARQTVRTALRDCTARGGACLGPRSARPKRAQRLLEEERCAGLRASLHEAPRSVGKEQRLWPLAAGAAGCCATGLTPAQLSLEAIRQALARLHVSWRRAQHWRTSPAPQYARKKSRARLIRLAASHPEWVRGFAAEVWWRRLKQPRLPAWTEAAPLRLEALLREQGAAAPKARCCYGLLRADTAQVWLRFVAGRPGSAVPCALLRWVCAQLAAAGKRALLLVWDNASWHGSQCVRDWIKAHNCAAKHEGGVRVLRCQLPGKRPWLNPIEAHWVHGKRAVVEPARTLTAQELATRVCGYYGCEQLPHLKQNVS